MYLKKDIGWRLGMQQEGKYGRRKGRTHAEVGAT
jgi:hypothetical protein